MYLYKMLQCVDGQFICTLCCMPLFCYVLYLFFAITECISMNVVSARVELYALFMYVVSA